MKCQFDGCTFKDHDEHYVMKHMVKFHNYCRKCKLPFEDWEALAKHRMGSLKHFACSICASDFKSPDGLRRHVELEHPINQKAKCLGCKVEFYSVAQMISHLEQGRCPVISAQQFTSHVQHKQIVTAMLSDTPNKATLGTGYLDAAVDTDEGGGVPLLDEEPADSNDQAVGLMDHAILEPERKTNPNSARFEKFPALPSSGHRSHASISGLSDTLSNISVSGGVTLPSTGRPSSAASSTVGKSSGVWDMNRPASQILGKGAKLTPVTKEWLKRENQKGSTTESETGQNLLGTRFWDPQSEAFRKESFYNPILETYECPFIPCDSKFMTPTDLEAHIEKAHRTVGVRCPKCMKSFKNISALVAHCEAPASKCKIRHSDKYSEAMDAFTGGFVEASEGLHPEAPTRIVHEYKTDKKGKEKLAKTHVIKHHVWNYASTTPTDWEHGEEQKRVEYERSKKGEGVQSPHQHLNIAARFDGGYPRSKNIFGAHAMLGLTGASHGEASQGLRTEDEDHVLYRVVDPKAKQKRVEWAHMARDNDRSSQKGQPSASSNVSTTGDSNC